jgi:hypothetical protein
MATAPQNVALDCVPSTSVSNPQYVLPFPAENSLFTLNTLHHSYTSPEKITASRTFKLTDMQKRPTKHSILKSYFFHKE